MKKYGTGFSLVEILLVIVLIGGLIAAGAFVYAKQNVESKQNNDKIAEQTQTQETINTRLKSTDYTDPNKDCGDQRNSFISNKIGVSFCYPENWILEEVIDTPSNHIIGSITLKSPDYIEVSDGFGGSNTGSSVTIFIQSIEKLQPTYIPLSAILDGTAQSKIYYDQVKVAKMAGIDGVSFVASYEGPGAKQTAIEVDGKNYMIGIQEDLDGPAFNDNLDIYDQIVASFELVK